MTNAASMAERSRDREETESAISDLKEIVEFIAAQNRPAPEKIGRGILDQVRILETFPFIGRTYPRRSNGTIREIIFGSYRIFYDVSEKSKAVRVLRVWHGTRSEPNLN